MSSNFVVAIDGPSGSGKSTVARKIATLHGLQYLDTGAMYRAATWYVLSLGIDPKQDPAAVVEAVKKLPLEIAVDPHIEQILVAGLDVTDEIRTERVTVAVSAIATNVAARPLIQSLQRIIITQAQPGIVAEGRDITTVIAPTAQVRVLLVASEASRLRRRAAQMEPAGGHISEADLRQQVLQRDERDSEVSVFHRAADGVVTVDSSDLTLDETIAAIDSLVVDQAVEFKGVRR